jgi:23S rRNA (cytosine1962-C5)-methyltransferase
MKQPAVILKKDRDKPIRQRHHWIFSGAVQSLPDFEDGDILPVRSHDGEFLGAAYFNRKSSIVGRMLSFDETPPLEAVGLKIADALELRKKFVEPVTNAERLINGEGDGLPGLIVDRYDDVLVLQVATLGMDKLKPVVLEYLVGALKPRSICEKSDLPTRSEEGLSDFEGRLYGEDIGSVEISEAGLFFLVEIRGAQKTGFYLDLRESRSLVRTLAEGLRVLNCFCYTGGFSVAALAGGAAAVESVDSSGPALSLARRNLSLNGFPEAGNRFVVADVFEYLRRDGPFYDFIILDPPAFAKKKADVIPACRGYKDINRLALRKAGRGSLLLTLCCSHFVDEPLFQKVVFQAAAESGREVRIIQRHRLAVDHPINVYHAESEYLKGFLLYVQ